MQTTSQDFAGQHVAVTGGTGWLGTAVVGELVERGATVHIPAWQQHEVDRSPWWGHERVSGAVGGDLSDEKQALSFFADLPALSASIHVAGGFAMAPIEQVDSEQVDAQLRLNALSCLWSCKASVASMRAGGQGGRIVNVTAGPGLGAGPGMVAYAMGKSAVAAITRSLAEELRAERILVNAIVPGVMDTPTNRKAMPDADFSSWSPLPAVAVTVANLASPRNETTTGAFVPV